ncbi:MAG: hypothetical protein HYS21_02110 [Deltaproteobacteria bacterium]|nr:hypothetical protein [Deltaproteobacteria bacterium]
MDRIEHFREFIRCFAKICSRISLYGLAHPATGSAISVFCDSLRELLKNEHLITISAVDGKVLVNGIVAEEKGPFHDLFLKRGLHSIVFEQGFGNEEVTSLLKAFASAAQAIEESLRDESVRNIKVNSVHYVKTGEKAEVEAVESFELETIEGLSLEKLLMKVIEQAVKKDEDRKRVFECVMKKFASELDDKVKEATFELEKEKDSILREKENTEKVISNSVLSTIVVDHDCNVVMFGADCESILGAKLKDKAGRPVWEGLNEGQMVTVAKSGGEAFTVSDIMVKGEDETKRILRASNSVIKNTEGKMVGLFSMLSDITKYRELDQMKKDFVANVTHELRTPLVATKQALSNLISFTDSLDDDQEKMINIALRNTERLYRLVNDILDFSKLEGGKIKLRQEIVETGLLIKEILSTVKPLYDSKGISIFVDSRSALPRLFADRDRVTQVFINLLSNAVKFTDKGGSVTIEAQNFKRKGADTLLELSVRDTGRGMEKKDLEKIFDKFIQVGTHDNTVMKGTGLGLTITKAIVELHGGEIRVDSEPGKGSVFTVSFPMLPEDAVYLNDANRTLNKAG